MAKNYHVDCLEDVENINYMYPTEKGIQCFLVISKCFKFYGLFLDLKF